MKLPISIAEKLMLLQKGEIISSSKLKHSVIDIMLGNGILKQQIQSRSKKMIFLRSPERLNDFLSNHFGINKLQDYISVQKQDDALRSDFVGISSDSKLRKVRTFKGFLVNSYTPIQTKLNNEPLLINPIDGTFQFIYDFERFSVPENITIVGVENPENFRYIHKQKYLFEDIKPLFISRYPQNQNKDLTKWLQSIPNSYLHFGDFDMSGVGIYMGEYKKYLGDKAKFFIPADIEDLIEKFGNRQLFDSQRDNSVEAPIDEPTLNYLIMIIQKYKKGLEQEVFINFNNYINKAKM